MKCVHSLLLTTLLFSTPHLHFGEVRTWKDKEGNTREAELVNAFGPMAYFKDVDNIYNPFKISELSDEDQAIVEAFKAEKKSTPWQDSKSTMAQLLKGRLFTYGDGKTTSFKYGPEPEPDFYALYFVASDSEEGKVFTAKLVTFYDQIKANGFQNFEIILISRDRTGVDQKKYMEEMKINWPAIKWSSRKWLRDLMAMGGPDDVNLVILDQERHILQRSDGQREELQPVHLLAYLNNLLSWTNPDNPLVMRYRFLQLLKTHLATNPEDTQPRPYQCSLEGIDFSIIPDRSFKIQLEVTEHGFTDNATIASEVPEAAREAIMKAVSGWMFIPRIKDGNYVRTRIAFPVQNKE